MIENLIARFREAGDKPAFIHNDRKVSYAHVVADIDKYHRMIMENGVKPSEIVAIVGDYSPEIYSFLLALVLNKNIVCPLTNESVVEKDKAFEIAAVQWFVEFSDDDDKIIFHRYDRVVKNELTRSLIQRGESGLILFSSGSTGQPKGMLHNFSTVLRRFKEPRPPVVAICFLMFDHFGGINTLLGITASHGTVVTVADRSVKTVCDTIQKYSVQLLPTTPSFLNMVVQTGVYKHFDLSSLRKITYGTEVMAQATLDRLKIVFPQAVLQQTYGLSELGVLNSKSRPDGSLWVQVGGKGFNLQVREGILWIKSEYAMVGYLNAPSPFDDEGWFNTQDQVEVDGDYLKILGRVTDLINVGGQKVYPSEIENIIIELENVEDVAVYSEANPLLGNIVVAEVQLVNPEPLNDLKRRIRHECLKHLAPYKVPTKVKLAENSLYSVRMKKKRSQIAAPSRSE